MELKELGGIALKKWQSPVQSGNCIFCIDCKDRCLNCRCPPILCNDNNAHNIYARIACYRTSDYFNGECYVSPAIKDDIHYQYGIRILEALSKGEDWKKIEKEYLNATN